MKFFEIFAAKIEISLESGNFYGNFPCAVGTLIFTSNDKKDLYSQGSLPAAQHAAGKVVYAEHDEYNGCGHLFHLHGQEHRGGRDKLDRPLDEIQTARVTHRALVVTDRKADQTDHAHVDDDVLQVGL